MYVLDSLKIHTSQLSIFLKREVQTQLGKVVLRDTEKQAGREAGIGADSRILQQDSLSLSYVLKERSLTLL